MRRKGEREKKDKKEEILERSLEQRSVSRKDRKDENKRD